jgi:hypothetical protein
MHCQSYCLGRFECHRSDCRHRDFDSPTPTTTPLPCRRRQTWSLERSPHSDDDGGSLSLSLSVSPNLSNGVCVRVVILFFRDTLWPTHTEGQTVSVVFVGVSTGRFFHTRRLLACAIRYLNPAQTREKGGRAKLVVLRIHS